MTGLQTKDVELSLTVTHEGKLYELDGFMFEAHYEVDGEDAPETWGYYGGEPASAAAWLLYHLKLSDQDQIDSYNVDAEREGFTPIPWKADTDLWSMLTEAQQATVEAKVEQDDRDYDAYEPEYEPDDAMDYFPY